MFEITFLRHGESVGNRDGYHQGQHNFPLTPTGEAQAQALGQYWRDHAVSFDQLITSPLTRARQTAEIIGQALGLAPVIDPLWTERHNGILQGLSYAEGQAVHPRPDFVTPYDPIGKTGESQWQLYLRTGKALQNLLRGEPGRYLVVSHGGLLNILMHILTGIVPQADFRGVRFPFENTAFTVTKHDPQNHTWKINAHNTRPHLPPDLPFAGSPYRFTFLRHGQSEGNLKHVFQGQADFPLSENGHREIALLAKDWLARGVTYDKIIASPLTRARQTAEALAQALGLEIEFDNKWKEIDNGEMAGLTHAEIQANFPNPSGELSIYDPLGNTGESWWDLHLRAGELVQELLLRPPGNYLVVSHDTLLNYVMRAIVGVHSTAYQIDHQTPWFRFGNTGYAQVAYKSQNHTWFIQRIGMRSHLQNSKSQGESNAS